MNTLIFGHYLLPCRISVAPRCVLKILYCQSPIYSLLTSFHVLQVAELNRCDHQYKEQITAAITLSERLVASKLGKQQYLENEKGITDKRAEIYKKMEEISTGLA